MRFSIQSPPMTAARANYRNRDQQVHGVSRGRHKLYAIRRALLSAGQVCWLDWDCRLTKPLPTTWWADRAAGPDIQVVLRWFSHAFCFWREPTQWSQLIPHGAQIYLRQSAFDEWLAIHDEFPEQNDEVALAALFERRLGGWDEQAAERMGTEGYILPGHRTNRQYRPPKHPLWVSQ
jgi:hypothetical protein